ncbi:MAG: hypothetical protein L6Q57_08740 [Alphaproteobacteria bacterium]|nr:hypothetical protein [Alphaproteobacteria bacterium]
MLVAFILILYLLQVLPAAQTAAFLLLIGLSYLALEVFVTSLGLLALNGLLALYASYALYNGLPTLLGVPIGWELVFGIAFVEVVGTLIALRFFLIALQKKAVTGREAMIGQSASVVDWQGRQGRVFVMGETWKAVSDQNLNLQRDAIVTIQAVDHLTLIIRERTTP